MVEIKMLKGETLYDLERKMILATLDVVGGSRTRAANILGISIRTIRNKLSEYRRAEMGGRYTPPPQGETEAAT
jgi:DNA-binding NtrC family response regulator